MFIVIGQRSTTTFWRWVRSAAVRDQTGLADEHQAAQWGHPMFGWRVKSMGGSMEKLGFQWSFIAISSVLFDGISLRFDGNLVGFHGIS